jgi:hypothetical protein
VRRREVAGDEHRDTVYDRVNVAVLTMQLIAFGA